MKIVNDPLTPALIAVLGGAALAFVLFVPFVAASYRRRGEFGWGRALLAGASLVYALALVAYTLLPFPQVDEGFCSTRIAQAGAQTQPFAWIGDMAAFDVADPLRNPALLQVLMNVALFVPLGMFLRHLGGRSVVVATLAGLGVSALIECTQLTGNWFLYPCPYRLFDVDDLIANTAGAFLGALAAPLLRIVPGQRLTAAPGAPRPVTIPRRLLGILCDVLGAWLTGAVLVAGVHGIVLVSGGSEQAPWIRALDQVLGSWVPLVALFVIVPMLGHGGTVGQRAVLLRPALPDGAVPSRARLLARSLLGVGGYLLLQAADAEGLSSLWGLVSLVGLFVIAERRGIGGVLTSTIMLDRRASAPAELHDHAQTRR
jgi:glycopeptide antibiotics resistance protein